MQRLQAKLIDHPVEAELGKANNVRSEGSKQEK